MCHRLGGGDSARLPNPTRGRPLVGVQVAPLAAPIPTHPDNSADALNVVDGVDAKWLLERPEDTW
jgi:hypothetical protein